jgi:hypothetical protein
MSGPAESPPNTSPGAGFSQVDIDLANHTLRVQISFSGLVAGTTAAHIHACTQLPGAGTASVATQLPSFTGFPLGVTSGSYDRTFSTQDPATFNPAFITANGGTVAAAEVALAICLASGRAYMNVHSSTFPGGEIRGFLAPVISGGGTTPGGNLLEVKFGLAGDPIDPPGQLGGGSTRDRVDPPVIVINSGDTVNYINAGAPHRVAIYDRGLTKNGSGPTTTLSDITDSAGTGTFLDDPVGRLALGGVGTNVSWTFTNPTNTAQQYLVICAFRPHFTENGQFQFVIVRPGTP